MLVGTLYASKTHTPCIFIRLALFINDDACMHANFTKNCHLIKYQKNYHINDCVGINRSHSLLLCPAIFNGWGWGHMASPLSLHPCLYVPYRYLFLSYNGCVTLTNLKFFFYLFWITVKAIKIVSYMCVLVCLPTSKHFDRLTSIFFSGLNKSSPPSSSCFISEI